MEKSVTWENPDAKPTAPVFINVDELTQEEKNAIASMSYNGGWRYGKQFILQSEFVKKDQTKGE